MNNLEHLGADGVAELFANLGDGCIAKLVVDGYRPFCEVCTMAGTGAHDCREGLREWLEAEYVEPDSLEKLVADLRRAASAYESSTIPCAYVLDGNQRCVDCGFNTHESCFRQMAKDVADKIERLVKQ